MSRNGIQSYNSSKVRTHDVYILQEISISLYSSSNYEVSTLEWLQMNDSTENCGPARPSHDAATSETGARMISCADHRIDSRELFVETREVLIHHGDDVYRLRLTAQNKLILTK